MNAVDEFTKSSRHKFIENLLDNSYQQGSFWAVKWDLPWLQLRNFCMGRINPSARLIRRQISNAED
jgi:hypothetical protein